MIYNFHKIINATLENLLILAEYRQKAILQSYKGDLENIGEMNSNLIEQIKDIKFDFHPSCAGGKACLRVYDKASKRVYHIGVSRLNDVDLKDIIRYIYCKGDYKKLDDFGKPSPFTIQQPFYSFPLSLLHGRSLPRRTT